MPAYPQARSLALMTQNLRCLPEAKSEEHLLSLRARVENLLRVIKDHDVEVLALQEVCSDSTFSALEMLLNRSESYGIVWRFALRSYAHYSYGRYREDLVLLSRQFPDDVRELPLPDPGLGRVLQAIHLPRLNLWVANTHLNHEDDGGYRRKIQMQVIAQEFKDEQALIVGDFNSAPSDDEGAPLRQALMTPHFPSASWPSHAPKERYDGAWSTSSLTLSEPSISTHSIGSDHLGVLFIF